MKILICSDGKHAHYFQRLSWVNAFNAAGCTAMLWDCKSTTAFDAFDNRDYYDAFEMFLDAAKVGNATAQYNVGVCGAIHNAAFFTPPVNPVRITL